MTAVAWQPGGSLFATASNDGTALVIDSDTGAAIVSLGSAEMFQSVSWNNRGDTLAIALGQQPLSLANGAPAAAVQKLSGHTAALHDIAWAPDDDRLVSTSGDGTARVWNLSDNAQIAQMLAGEALRSAGA